MPSVFTKIIQGELPCYKVHEDEYTLSILSIEPVTVGHTLVIPKIEVDAFFEVPEPYYSQIFKNAKIIAQAIKNVTKCKRVATIIQGFEVPHCHYHLIPVNSPQEVSFQLAHKESAQVMQKMLDDLKHELKRLNF